MSVTKTYDSRVPLNRGSEIKIFFADGTESVYVIDHYVGRGGFALTYIAFEKDTKSKKYYAIKEFFPNDENIVRGNDGKISFLNDKKDKSGGSISSMCSVFFEREREMTEVALKLYDSRGMDAHQNNPDVLSFDGPYLANNGNYYCILDTVGGEPLQTYILSGWKGGVIGKDRNSKLNNLLDILSDVTKQLSSLHGDKNMYHLDLSTSNIYISKINGGTELRAQIIDFGSAVCFDCIPECGHSFTSNDFSSHEIASYKRQNYVFYPESRKCFNETADTFSVCSILYYCVTGRIFSGTFIDKELISKLYPDEIYDAFSEKLCLFFEKGMSALASERYKNTYELLCALNDLKECFSGKGLLSNVSDDDIMSYLLLYKYPLYSVFSNDEDINVLFLGSGAFIEKLVCATLSMGQMNGKKLNIAIVSQDAIGFRKKLISNMPEIVNYSNISNCAKEENQYVYFSFENVKNILSKREVYNTVNKYINYKYVVISTGTNESNSTLAEIYSKYNFQSKEKRTVIYYMDEDVADNNLGYTRQIKESKNISFVPFSYDECYDDVQKIGLLAFNFHYLYSKVYCTKESFEDVMHSFSHDRDGYGQKSSLALALHTKYKLASMGIFIDENNKLYFKKENELKEINKESLISLYYNEINQNINRFISLEHRRWMMFMISCGYRFPSFEKMKSYAYEYSENGIFNKGFKCKCAPELFHHALVPCGEDGLALEGLSHDLWDMYKSIEEIQNTTYDKLDKVSLSVHFLSGEKIKSSSVRNNVLWHLERLENFIPIDNEFLIKRFKKIVRDAKKLFESPYEIFSFLADIEEVKKSFIENNIKADYWWNRLNDSLAIFKEYASYVDYKAYDKVIVENLLWGFFADKRTVVVKLESNSKNNAFLENVTVPCVVNAFEVIYLSSSLEENVLNEEVSFLKSDERKISSKIKILKDKSENGIKKYLKRLFEILGKDAIIDVTGAESTFASLVVEFAKENGIPVVSFDFETNTIVDIKSFSTAFIYNYGISQNEVLGITQNQ